VRSRTAGVMTTLMRNGRDRRLEKPVKCHARKERVFLVGTRSADHIRASGHSGCIQRPDTWLHPNASLKCQIPLAPRAPSIHGTFRTSCSWSAMSVGWGKADIVRTRTNSATDRCCRKRSHRLCSRQHTESISGADQQPRFASLIFDKVLVRMCAFRTFKTAHVISGLRWFDPA
jgi:hypothetical protein